MSQIIVNAAPFSQLNGIEDLSTMPLPVIPDVLPTHLPKIYLYTQKGPTSAQLLSGSDLAAMYGLDSFDLRKKYANHATVLANLVNAKGNAIMVERVKPSDANGPAAVTLMLDVLPTNVPTYQRSADGKYVLDAQLNPIPTGQTVAGFSVKWVYQPIAVDLQGNSLFGQVAEQPGDQVDATTQAQSIRYPIMDLEVANFGEYGNNIGLRMWAPNIYSSQPLNPGLISSNRAYPFRLACMSRATSTSTPTIVPSLAAEQFVDVTFKPDVIDPVTDKQMNINDVFIKAYQDINTPGQAPIYGPFGRIHTYDAKIATLLQEFYTAEIPHIDANSDLKNVADEIYAFNMISGVNSNGSPYHSFVMVNTGTNAVRLTENTTVYALGGSDGTMNDVNFAASVSTLVAQYGDINSYLQNTAKYPESIIYDTGFPLDTKYALTNFIAVRKDTAVVLGTHVAGAAPLTQSQESSLAVALRTHIQMFPESDFFGTSTVRGMIVGRSGTLLNSQYKKSLPLTIELAVKAADYMGAGNGSWKPGKSFDVAPANNITLFTDINVTFTPVSVRNKDWTNGLVWVESFDRNKYYFPALKTVYDNDTSVLTNFFTMMACVELEKVCDRSRRMFSGNSSLTNLQLVEQVNKYITDNVKGRFDGKYVIVPNTYFTAADINRGYSWATDVTIYSPNMKTVGTFSIKARRIDQLAKA